MPLQTMYYRFGWEGDTLYAASDSDEIPVQVKPRVGKPSCPARIKKGRRFAVKGSVKPGQGTVPTLKVKVYRRNAGGAYVSYKTYRAKVAGTRYSASIRLKGTGKYRFRAITSASAEFAAGASSLSRVLTVRR